MTFPFRLFKDTTQFPAENSPVIGSAVSHWVEVALLSYNWVTYTVLKFEVPDTLNAYVVFVALTPILPS